MSKDSSEAVDDSKPTLEVAFAEAVWAMLKWAENRSGTYINFEQAAPFVAGLPEFWREPARVMACVGYYASADEWMKQHVEDEA